MKHIDEDRLLEYALEVIADESERDTIERHLKQCSSCHSILMSIHSDIGVISSVRPRSASMTHPGRKTRYGTLGPILRAAALIAFGISVGYGASTWTPEEHHCISPAYMTFDMPESALSGYSVADATEVDFGAVSE